MDPRVPVSGSVSVFPVVVSGFLPAVLRYPVSGSVRGGSASGSVAGT